MQVIDGTSCTHDSFNKCVNGLCRLAGCDNILFSSAVLGEFVSLRLHMFSNEISVF